MPSFTTLLIHTCTIQRKALTQVAYEKVKSWDTIASNVPCRHNSDNGAKIADTEIRVNTDDDVFFFNPGVSIARDNRIVYDGRNFDVIKVNKLYDSTALHHLEVKARYVDNA